MLLDGGEVWKGAAPIAGPPQPQTGPRAPAVGITITVPREDIPLNDFLVHAHVLSGPDADNLWKDDCPNGREGLGIPARPEIP